MNKDYFMEDISVAIQELNTIINSLQMEKLDIFKLNTFNFHYLNSGIKIAQKLSKYQKKIQVFLIFLNKKT